jgi:hypothetical protein
MLQLEGDHKPKKFDTTVEPLEKMRELLGDDDAVLFYDVGLFNKKSGVVTRLCGRYIMHFFTDYRHIAESPRNLETVFFAAVFRPAMAEGTRYLNGFVSNTNPLRGQPTFGTFERDPQIPDTRPNGFLTGA